jgi:hypothetical protein
VELNESIFNYLKGVAVIAAIVQLRIYTDESRQSNPHTMPYIVYSKVSETEVDTMLEQSQMLIASTYQFDVWAKSRHAARDLAKQVRKAFKGFRGVMGTGGVTISAIEKINAMSDIDRDASTGEVAFREMLEFKIWHYETA